MAATTYDMTAASAALKIRFDKGRLETMAYKSNPFFAMVPKDTDCGGESFVLPVERDLPTGGTASFATAQANSKPGVDVKFTITLADDYQTVQIANKVVEASKNNLSAFLKIADHKIGRAVQSSVNRIAGHLFRSGTGTRGQISTISSGVITLADARTVTQFQVGQILQACATDGGTARADLGYVIAVNRNSGTVTVSATDGGSAGNPTSWANSDYLSLQGDLNATGKGLAAWLPQTDPSGGESFFGVDRSKDRSRLAGIYYDGSNQNIEEALIDGIALASQEEAGPTHVFTNWGSWAALQKSFHGKVDYVDFAGPANIVFRGIKINGPNGPVSVFQDRSCPANTAYALDLETWMLASINEVPHILTYGGEGLEMLRVSNADAIEARVGAYYQLACKRPGSNAVIKLGA